jgi:hypothetical protein
VATRNLCEDNPRCQAALAAIERQPHAVAPTPELGAEFEVDPGTGRLRPKGAVL